jgi:hypothetical protein
VSGKLQLIVLDDARVTGTAWIAGQLPLAAKADILRGLCVPFCARKGRKSLE